MNGHEPESGAVETPAGTPDATDPAIEPSQELPPAVQRFQSCRWRKPAEDGTPDHCTHRDVHPITGTTGFNADAWCLDCGHFKMRRNPRKRPVIPEDRQYY